MGRSVIAGLLVALTFGLVITAPAAKKSQPRCIPRVVSEFSGKVVGVSDADTVTVLTPDKQQIKVRLDGIDAPEKSQQHGDRAKQALAALVFGQHVVVKKTGEDRYGRTLGIIMYGSVHVNDRMVADGWAWHYTDYNCEDRIANLESAARTAKRGLWEFDRPIPPWEFRARKRTTANVKPPTPIKGKAPTTTASAEYWLNMGNGVRHNSSCQWFRNTKRGRVCSPTEGKPCGMCGG